MEKSSLNAASTRTMPASSTAAKVAIPARRAVSPRRAEASSLPNNAKKPARKEYALRPSASISAKLPISDIAEPHSITVFFQRSGCYAIRRSFRSAVRLLARRYLPRLLQRVALFAPLADSAVHGNDIRVSHLLQVIGGQRGTEPPATIKDKFSVQIGIRYLNVA